MHLGRRLARGEQDLALRAGRWSNLATRVSRLAPALEDRLTRVTRSIRALGPYAAIALALPGGTLIVLAMLGLRHRTALYPLRAPALGLIVAAASLVLAAST